MRLGGAILRRSSLRLALFAMLVQLVATYGHLHPEDFYRFLPGNHAAVTVSSLPASPHGQTGLAADDDCPLCLSLQILGSSALPDIVALAPPNDRGRSLRTVPALWLYSPPPQLPFRTRAPPSV